METLFIGVESTLLRPPRKFLPELPGKQLQYLIPMPMPSI
jgi:hypothetical protein